MEAKGPLSSSASLLEQGPRRSSVLRLKRSFGRRCEDSEHNTQADVKPH